MGIVFANTKECFELAKQILSYYTDILGPDCSSELLHFSENLIYLVKDIRGRKRAILRLSRPGYHTLEELEAEIRWMVKVRQDTGLNSREPIADRDGKYIHAIKSEDGVEYYGVLFTYLSGKLLEELDVAEQPMWFKKLGEVTAALHNHARKWNESRSLPRFRWDYDTTLGTQAIWGNWRKVPALTAKAYAVLKEADELIRQRLEKYGTTEENYGLIHSDLRGSNLLTEGETLKIIDFDDCGYGWYMQDLAASLSFMETETVVSYLIEAWLNGYCKLASIQQKDIDMIPTFIMMRRLQLLAWVTSRASSDAVLKIKRDFTAETVELAKYYLKQTK